MRQFMIEPPPSSHILYKQAASFTNYQPPPMASSTTFFFLFLSLLAFLPPFTSSTSYSTNTICHSTIDPSFCKTVLPKNNSANVYDSGRYAILQSLHTSINFVYLLKSLTQLPLLSTPISGALNDCIQLSQLNIDFLTQSLNTLNGCSSLLPTTTAEDIQSVLSAVLTNQQTCSDGIDEISSSSIIDIAPLTAPLLRCSKMYSMSLALFINGWVPDVKEVPSTQLSNPHRYFGSGPLPLKLADDARKVYLSLGNRKLLQTTNGTVSDKVLISQMVVVSQNGSGNFSTITDALNFAPNNSNGNNGYFLIYITQGVYEEYVIVAKNKKYLMMMGDGINRTIITGDHNVIDGWTTFNSATFAVTSPNFIAVNMTIRNTAGAEKHQAVALRNGADLSVFYQCSFEGYQDTLYTHSLRQFYRECDIYGTVDFIFGNAAVVFQNCNMYPRLPMAQQFNAITAQGRTDPNQNTGTVIHNCVVQPATDLAAANNSADTYLGRPWKEYSRTVYMHTFMDGFIKAKGWTEWNGDFALVTLYYGEYNNSGKGSRTGGRVSWPGYRVMNISEATNFTAESFLLVDQWLPQTLVPYSDGLI